MPAVINLRSAGYKPNDPRVRYCARPWAGWNGSVLGNPFHLRKYEIHDEQSRLRVIAAYEEWLRNEIANGAPDILQALADIREDDLLGCWCVPLPCHVDVIVKVWRELQQTETS